MAVATAQFETVWIVTGGVDLANRNQPARLNQLIDLASSPPEQISFALKLIETDQSLSVVLAAAEILGDAVLPQAYAPLLKQYAHFDTDGVKRDPGGFVRAAILRALRPLLRPTDIDIMEHAVTTYEFMPPRRSEVAILIRSNALLALNQIDTDAASYHAVRLLSDPFTSDMTGEPALTAARVLASQGNLLPLYYHVLYAQNPISELLVEELRSLRNVPPSALEAVIDKYRASEDEMILTGLFDLILSLPASSRYSDEPRRFLRTTSSLDVYRYVVTEIVAAHKEHLPTLIEVATAEQDSRKIRILIEALALLSADRRAIDTVRVLERLLLTTIAYADAGQMC